MRKQRRQLRGFTLLDMLWSVITIALLVALLLPAVQSTRERARRISCENNLRQLGVALAQYQQLHGLLPPGSVSSHQPVTWLQPSSGISWLAQIMPQLGESAIWQQVHAEDPFLSFSAYRQDPDPTMMPRADTSTEPGAERKVFYPVVSILRCPSFGGAWSANSGLTNYAACHHSREQPISEDGDGMFSVNSSESLEHIPDGRSTTLLVGEISSGLQGHGWVFGDRTVLRNGDTLASEESSSMVSNMQNLALEGDTEADRLKTRELSDQVGPFGSSHAYHVNFLLADGSVRPLAKTIDPLLLRSLISKADSLPLGDGGF